MIGWSGWCDPLHVITDHWLDVLTEQCKYTAWYVCGLPVKDVKQIEGHNKCKPIKSLAALLFYIYLLHMKMMYTKIVFHNSIIIIIIITFIQYILQIN